MTIFYLRAHPALPKGPRVGLTAFALACTLALLPCAAFAQQSRQAVVAPQVGLGQTPPNAKQPPAAPPSSTLQPSETSHGFFQKVPLLWPNGQPSSVALMLSDFSGWTAGDSRLAQGLQAQGALVAEIDTQQVLAALRENEADCLGLQGDLDNFSRVLQAQAQLASYHPPILVGAGSPASTLVYQALATAPEGTFTGGLSIENASNQGRAIHLPMPLCRDQMPMARPHGAAQAKSTAYNYDWKAQAIDAPMVVLTTAASDTPSQVANPSAPAQPAKGDSQAPVSTTEKPDAIPKVMPLGAPLAEPAALATFQRSYADLAAQQNILAAPPSVVANLPLVESKATAEQRAAAHPQTLAIMLSGDGGWAGLDKDLAQGLNDEGIDVVGFDSLRYFWAKRTPDSTAQDLARILRYYQSQPAWKQPKIMLIGYSQGADVLAFAVNRLPADLKAQLSAVVLLGMGEHAAFEFHMSNWLGDSTDGPSTLAEAAQLPAGLGVCIYGAEDEDAVCPKLPADSPVRTVKLAGGHHFDGDYAALAKAVLKAAGNSQ